MLAAGSDEAVLLKGKRFEIKHAASCIVLQLSRSDCFLYVSGCFHSASFCPFLDFSQVSLRKTAIV